MFDICHLTSVILFLVGAGMGVACLLASAHVLSSCQVVSKSHETKWLAGLSLSK